MEVIIIIFWQILIAIVTSTVRALRARRIREADGSLCNNCLYAHVACRTGRRKLTRCTYAWNAREIRFAVSSCTMYCNRDAARRVVRIDGFASREPVAAEAVAQNQ
ncbi:MAG TPA: hypothetical protein VKW78_11925 [Terriglobales bacterium]|nr:hypothetical protein [Terriglobales bacterium]